MLPLWLVGEEVAIGLQGLIYHCGELKDSWHGGFVLSLVMTHLYSTMLFWSNPSHFAKLQFKEQERQRMREEVLREILAEQQSKKGAPEKQ
jgi:hypothetical protein